MMTETGIIKNLTARFINNTGYLEKASNANLDNKTANAGYNNYTCWGRDYAKIIGESEYIWNGVAWCDEYIDVNFVNEFGIDVAKKLLGGFSAYTPTSAQYFKNMGRWTTKNPKEGYVIFFKDSGGTICHTGYVSDADSSYVYTNEGNTSSASGVVANGGGVANKKYSLSYSRIAGYGMPDYSIVVKEMNELMSKEYDELKQLIEIQNRIIENQSAAIDSLSEQCKLLLDVEETTMVYDYVDSNMPEWARDAVTAAMESGIIKGNEDGRLRLSFKDLRTIVREYRAGLYNKKG